MNRCQLAGARVIRFVSRSGLAALLLAAAALLVPAAAMGAEGDPGALRPPGQAPGSRSRAAIALLRSRQLTSSDELPAHRPDRGLNSVLDLAAVSAAGTSSGRSAAGGERRTCSRRIAATRGETRRMRLVASMPDASGRSRSISATPGLTSAASETASAASPASAATAIPSLTSSSRTPSRNSRCRSTTITESSASAGFAMRLFYRKGGLEDLLRRDRWLRSACCTALGTTRSGGAALWEHSPRGRAGAKRGV